MLINIDRKWWRAAVAALGLSLVAGCSLFSSSDKRYEPVPLTEYTAGIALGARWSVSVGSGGSSSFAPEVVGDAVYAATPNGGVAKVALATGAVLWQAQAGRLSAGVGSDGRVTAVAAPDGTLIAYDDTGTEKWKAKASSRVEIPPVVGAGIVAVRSSDYRIQAFDAETGEALWNVQRPGPALALKTAMRMVIVEGLLISGLPNGKLIAIGAQDGMVQWEGTVAVSRGATDLERISDIVGAPQLQGPIMCGLAYQGNIVCFDISQGGYPMWEQRYSSNVGMGSDSQSVYAPDEHDVVHAYALQDGKERWKQDALRNRRLSEPAVVRQGVAVGDYDGYVHVMAREDGRLLGRLQVGGGAVLSPLVATNEGVLVQTGSGNLVLIGVN